MPIWRVNLKKNTNRLLLCSVIILIVIMAGSCGDKKNQVTVKLKFDCFSSKLIDTLSTVLLSNSYSDLGGGGGSFNLFAANRVYIKNLTKGTDSLFYIEFAEKASYEYLHIEGFVNGYLFNGTKRKLDFSSITGDTTEVLICFEPNVKIISN